MRQFAIFACFVVGISLVTSALAQPPERRADRNLRQLDRQALRMARRAEYYPQTTWTQVNPWIKTYNIPPLRPLERAANAVERAADATGRAIDATADVAARARFGFNQAVRPDTADAWFYDYYTYWPSYYIPGTDGGKYYGEVIRYYDHDFDGVYESYFDYRDLDRDGIYDEFDRYDFTASDSDVDTSFSPDDATRHTVTGKVEARKMAKVNGVEFLIVRISSTNSKPVVVDLGPADQFNEVKITIGETLSAVGPIERIGEKTILIAESVTLPEQREISIDRPLPRITGTVQEIKRIPINEREHVFAVVAANDGNVLVDLGSSEAFEATLNPKEEIVVYGYPVRAHDHQVYVAHKIDVGGRTHTIVRWK